MSTLKVHNTLTGKKEDFKPISGNKVTMYACGPTPYDFSHLGHARMFINFDVIQRFLRFSGYDVTYVRNITDIEDKIINRAKQRGVKPEELAREYTYLFWHDMHQLNVQSPQFEPRCTEFIPEMIEFIKGLIESKHAYAVGGDVYFDVASFKQYGQLKKQSLEDMMVGAREDQVRSQDELLERKRSPADFALWKGAAEDEPGWNSPWGRGRPGWHLECSVMNKHVLGETIDLHGGGIDLIFPHHENELAQSEALHGKPLARYWLHNNFVNIDKEKMAKSLGNFRTIQDVLADYSADAVRMFVLQTHYRSPIDFTADNMNAASSSMSRLMRAVRSHPDLPAEELQAAIKGKPELQSAMNDFMTAMNDDFHTPQAVSVLFALADKTFSAPDAKTSQQFAALLRHLARTLGFTLEDTSRKVDSKTAESLLDFILTLRQSARGRKDFQTSDEIRDGLQNLGFKIMDSKEGSSWERI